MSAISADAIADWHGWGLPTYALHIGPLPKRKGPCLYVVVGVTTWPLAYFRSERDARLALSLIDQLAAARATT